MSPLEKLLKSRGKNEHKEQKLPNPCLSVVRMSHKRYRATGICLPYPWPKTLSGGGGRMGPLSPSFQICQANKYVCMHHQPHRRGCFRLQDNIWEKQSLPEQADMLLFIHQHCISHLPPTCASRIFNFFILSKPLDNSYFTFLCCVVGAVQERHWLNRLLRSPFFHPGPNLWSHRIMLKMYKMDVYKNSMERSV